MYSMEHQNRARQQWRLLNKRSNIACNIAEYQINYKVWKIMQFITTSNFSDPKLFDNKSITTDLSAMKNSDLTLSLQFIQHTPDIIAIPAAQLTTSSNKTITLHNIYYFTNTLFGPLNNLEFIQNFKFSKLLIVASTMIYDSLLRNPLSRKSPRLDCWKLFYGFIFKSFPNYLPQLGAIPYLKDNLRIHSRAKQFNLTTKLMDECGLIIYPEHSFMPNGVMVISESTS